jgi:formylmethanofuran dehydrogenase subunit C
MTLHFAHRGVSRVPIEVEGLTPDILASKTVADIERLPIFHGNQQIPVAEFFAGCGGRGICPGCTGSAPK